MDIIKNIEYDQYYTHDIVESEYTQTSFKQSNKQCNIQQTNKEKDNKPSNIKPSNIKQSKKKEYCMIIQLIKKDKNGDLVKN